jgi:trehalose 6-phosphate synthase/phosphatase
MPTLINVSNRLPVTVEGGKITKSSGGLVAALEGLSEREYTTKWIGWPGAAFPEAARREEIERTLVEEQGCLPVFLSEEEAEAHYEGFSNSSIWPLLHYLPNYLRYEPPWWQHYQEVNQRFADKVLETAHEGDLVWVHDYQLMLLPALLKAAAPHLRVGFFLHTPFPVYEIFRCHPRAGELAAGMLGADRIGFHTFGYLRHFCGTVQRLLGIEPELTHIRTEGHWTALGVYPIGINAAKFEETLNSPEFSLRREEFRASHQGKRIVLSVERMDYTKGILHRLEAIDYFLAGLDSMDDVRFIFVSVPSREGIEEYQALREEVEAQVGRLNGKYATLRNSPVHFIHGSVEFTDLCAMYALADVALVTPLIDGMNLVAKEYLACQRENSGLLILSKFAGAAEELFDALLVNPYDAPAVAETLSAALALPVKERRMRNQAMRERVMRYDAQHWARSFIDDLILRPTSEPVAAGTELGEARSQLLRALSEGKRIALFLDYDGTLREIEREPKSAEPSPAVHALLQRLRDRSDLGVTIISGRAQGELEAWLGAYPFGLIAEHGASLRRPGQREWEQLDRNVSYAWKAELLTILQVYEAATPGSFVEEKRSSIVWHYRKADLEFGAWKAHQLAEELAALTANEQIQVRHGKKIVEVTAAQVNKGAAIASILDEDKAYEIALCAGDDQTDESMFKLSIARLLSVKVGNGATQAQFRVANPAAFRRFLDEALRFAG